MSAWGFSLVYKKKVNNRLEIPAGIYDPLMKKKHALTAFYKKNQVIKFPHFFILDIGYFVSLRRLNRPLEGETQLSFMKSYEGKNSLATGTLYHTFHRIMYPP